MASQLNGFNGHRRISGESDVSPSDQNMIKACIQRSLDKETYSKFQQVLDYVGDPVYNSLYEHYHVNLIAQIEFVKDSMPPGYSLQTHAGLKVKFYSFKLILDIGNAVIKRLNAGEEKAEEKFVKLAKILLFHGLTAKSETANLALVELEQLCLKRKISLQNLYYQYRTKFLRLIIKAILFKLTSTDNNAPLDSCTSMESSMDGSASMSSTSTTTRRGNRVITFMTRSLEVFNIAVITCEDVTQSLIILTNMIHKEKFNAAIKQFLEYLAQYQNIDLATLVRGHIQAIVVSMLLKRKLSHFDMTASLNLLCSFCSKTPREMLATKFTFIKGRLLLQYHVDPKSVTDGVYFLSKFEKDEHEQPFEDEFDDDSHFIEYLSPSIIGILLGMDSHFISIQQELGSKDSIDKIRGLKKLMECLDTKQIQTIHVKLLSTLSLLVRLRPERKNADLNKAILDLWSSFTSNLSADLKASLIVNICIALFDLLEDDPEGASHIYSDIICQEEKPGLAEKWKTLFFIPDSPQFAKINDFLKPHVIRQESCSDLAAVEKCIESVLPLLKFESHKSRYLALTRIKKLLQINQPLLISSMTANLDQPLDSFISRTIESLLSLSSTGDTECLALIAECLGTLGVVNPIRLEHLIYGKLPLVDKSVAITNLSDNEFMIDLIERLKTSLFSHQISESETANYALQVVVETYSVLKEGSLFRERLSTEALRACSICQNTSYSGVKKATASVETTVFEELKTEGNFSYKEWLNRFMIQLVAEVDDKRVQEVLYACTYVARHNQRLAEHLLTHIAIHIIINQTFDRTQSRVTNTQRDHKSLKVLKTEFTRITSERLDQISSQDVGKIYKDSSTLTLKTLVVQCSKMVFCVLDAIYMIDRDTRSKRLSLNAYQYAAVQAFIKTLDLVSLHRLAKVCRQHARALCYLEQYLFTDKQKLDSFAKDLQQLYISLNDPYEAAGIDMVRTSYTTLVDDMTRFEATGQYDKAFVCGSVSLEPNNSDKEIAFVRDGLRCLAFQGDYQRLHEASRQFMTDYSSHKSAVMPYAIEASLNLGRWSDLKSTIQTERDNLPLGKISVGLGYLMNTMLDAPVSLQGALKKVRAQAMEPLSIAMMDQSAYIRGYENLLALHRIGDFAPVADIVEKCCQLEPWNENTVTQVQTLIDTGLRQLLNRWSVRNRLVDPTLKSLEHIMAWQRAMCSGLIEKYPFIRDKMNIELGKSWLNSADCAREARSFERSFLCLTQARKCFESQFHNLPLDLRVKYHIGLARLDWDQGERTKAIRSLKLTWSRLNDHQIIGHLRSRRQLNFDNDPFPNLTSVQRCDACSKCGDTQPFLDIRMLLTKYCEEAAAEIPENLFFMYEECVHLGKQQEETYFRLARYYDKLLEYYVDNPTLCGEQPNMEEKSHWDATQRFSQSLSGDREGVYTKLMEHSIVAFGNSLKFGTRNLQESMPRMMTIFYDLGMKKHKINVSRVISSRIESAIRFIDELKKILPPYYFLTALSLLLSRVSHPHSGVSKKTCEILELLLMNYPYQMTWRIIALFNDENEDRKRAARQIMSTVRKLPKKLEIEKIMNDTYDFSKTIAEICKAHTDQDKSRPEKSRKRLSGYVPITTLSARASRLNFEKCRVIAPVQASMLAIMPMNRKCTDSNGNDKHVVFPEQNGLMLRSVDQQAKVYNSLQQPRMITLRCENGKSINILCKAGDDMRKDSRCIEFLNLLNRILRRDAQSNGRCFDIKTFLVLPLESLAGIIEMIPNLEPLRGIIEGLYKERNPTMSLNALVQNKKNAHHSPADVRDNFIKNIMPKVTPPVMPTWFLRKFVEPTSWYMARLAFTRSCAVNSMGGYIIGLGDRHLDNILIDTCTGRVVHVDFNLLFHQAETLPVPETVPFRLTPNFVSAFGSLGAEGNFRKVSEITMRVMRKEKDALLTTLKPFMHDPCSEWTKVRDIVTVRGSSKPDLDDRNAENKGAKMRIEVCERKLKGFPRSKKFKPLRLIDSYSVEAQVDNLIEEAMDPANLASMYYGWLPHI